MAYCLFSSDYYSSDVSCYESVCGGYVTHVAKKRILFPSQLPPPICGIIDPQVWIDRNKIVTELVRKSDYIPIGLPYDGESFEDKTASDAAARLKMLKVAGYNVPQYAIDALRIEAALGADEK